MSTVTSAGSTSALAALYNSPSTTKVGAQASQTEMNQFLTLLTTELKNQDPTSPTDPTEFVSQLAQMSTVEQLTQTNTTLTSMSKTLSGLALGQYSALINHSVSASVSAVTVPTSGSVSTPMTFNVSSPSMSNIRVAITNASGAEVGSLPISGTTGTVTFDGTDGRGHALSAGQYTVSLVGTTGTGKNAAQSSAGTLTTSGTVTGVVQNGSGGWQLQLKNGQTVDATSITSSS